jgi:transcriptional regulator with XRE-family HTH domain
MIQVMRHGDSDTKEQPAFAMVDAMEYRRRVGRKLREIRERHRLSTRQVAERAAMSQSKLLRIEDAQVPASPQDIALLLDAVRATDDERWDIRADTQTLVSTAQPGFEVLIARGDQSVEEKVGRLFEAATTIRTMDCLTIPGLLQTPAYMKALAIAPEATTDHLVEAHVSSRSRFNTILNDTSKQFRVVIFEQVLLNRFLDPDGMCEQLAHILSVGKLPNIDVRLVPTNLRLKYVPNIASWLYDNHYVTIDTIVGIMGSRWPEIIKYHEDAFEFYFRNALAGDQACERIDQLSSHIKDEFEIIDIRVN